MSRFRIENSAISRTRRIARFQIATECAALAHAARCRSPASCRLPRRPSRPRRPAPSGARPRARRAPARPRPGRGRTISARWQMPATSSKSDETSSTERPPSSAGCEQPVDLGLGADVDAEGRLLQHQQPAAGLRASAPAPPSAGCRRRAWRSPARVSAGAPTNGAARGGTRLRSALGRDRRAAAARPASGRVDEQVLAHGQVRREALLAALARDEADAARRPRRAGRRPASGSPASVHRARRASGDVAEDGAADRVVAGAAQADEAERSRRRRRVERDRPGTAGDQSSTGEQRSRRARAGGCLRTARRASGRRCCGRARAGRGLGDRRASRPGGRRAAP